MKRPKIPVLLQVSVAHFVSHIHLLAVPALLPLLPEALNVSYVELGAAISIFSIVSVLIQTPLGFAVDRFGARKILCFGLALGSGSYLLLALFPSYACLVAAMALAGLANGAYHPADYAMLSRSVHDARMGRAFSIHSFAGFAGSAVTPAIVVTLASWRGMPTALAVTGLFGVAAFCLLAVSALESQDTKTPESPPARLEKRAPALSVISAPVVLLTILFVLLNLSCSSIERFSASTLIQGYGVDLALANAALTAFLVCSACGVLGGGFLADRTRRHGYVAALAFGAAAVCMVIITVFRLHPAVLVALFALVGFLTGVIVPSRDMLVRAASPKGSEGKFFGVVFTGFNIGGTIGPVLFGLLLDHGLPAMVFWSTVAFMLLTVLLTLIQENKAGALSRGNA
jgi:predicted MFS family arabinose efflux permease